MGDTLEYVGGLITAPPRVTYVNQLVIDCEILAVQDSGLAIRYVGTLTTVISILVNL